jgi:ribonuclease Z
MFPISTPSTSEWLCSNDILSWKFPASIGSYTLIGRSRAADATSLFIPELDMLLDCGCLATTTRPLYVFITHSHSDHCLDVVRIVSRSRPPQIYLPISAVQPMKDYIEKCQILRSGGRIDPDPTTWIPNCELIGVKPDDLLIFRKNMRIRVFDMDHSVPCCGYGFYEVRQKLKKEYEHLTSKDIGNLKRENRNLQLSEERLVPLFAFMGDTTASIFERYQIELFQFPLIIIECSFIDNEAHAERAADVKHVIWVRE